MALIVEIENYNFRAQKVNKNTMRYEGVRY